MEKLRVLGLNPYDTSRGMQQNGPSSYSNPMSTGMVEASMCTTHTTEMVMVLQEMPTCYDIFIFSCQV